MKKIILFSIIMLLFELHATSNKETWLFFNGEFSHSQTLQVANPDLKVNFNSSGIRLSYFDFGDNDVGIVVHDSFHIPNKGSVQLSSHSIDISLLDSEIKLLLGLMIGPVFKKSLDLETDFYFGIGPRIQQISVIEEVYSTQYSSLMSILFGLGVDAGIKTNVGKRMLLNVGLMTDFSFYSFNMITSYFGKNVSNITFSPYVGVGMLFD